MGRLEERYGPADSRRRLERSEAREAESQSEARERTKETSKPADKDKGTLPKETTVERDKKPEARPTLPFRPTFQFRSAGSKASKPDTGSNAADRAAAARKITEQFQLSVAKTAAAGEPKMSPIPGQSTPIKEDAEQSKPATSEKSSVPTSEKVGAAAEVRGGEQHGAADKNPAFANAANRSAREGGLDWDSPLIDLPTGESGVGFATTSRPARGR